MRRIAIATSAFAVIAAIVGACSVLPASEVERTAVADNMLLQTQMAAISGTATVEADRVMITVEHAQTAVRQVDELNARLQGMLAQEGTPAEFIQQTMPQVGQVEAPTIQATSALAADFAAGTVVPQITPTAVAANATPEAQSAAQPGLSNIVTAPGVGDNDCPLSEQNAFTPQDVEIYVTAVANGIQPGTNIASRWYREGVELVYHDFTPDFAINDNCIWFYMDQTDTAFTPGNWTVQLEINGQIVGQPVPFTITGDAPAGDTMGEEAMAEGTAAQ